MKTPEDAGMHTIERAGETMALRITRNNGDLHAHLFPWPLPDGAMQDLDRYALDLAECGADVDGDWYDLPDDEIVAEIDVYLIDSQPRPIPYAFAREP